MICDKIFMKSESEMFFHQVENVLMFCSDCSHAKFAVMFSVRVGLSLLLLGGIQGL